jgi:hypothetical protein
MREVQTHTDISATSFGLVATFTLASDSSVSLFVEAALTSKTVNVSSLGIFARKFFAIE